MGKFTCGECEDCFRKWPSVADGPFDYVYDVALRTKLEEKCGLCLSDPEETIVVMLDTCVDDAPCEGDGWRPGHVR